MARKQDHHRTSGIDVQNACRSGRIEQGEVDLSALPRCADLAGETPVAVKYRLAFFDSGAAHPLSCTINVQARVSVACARCLEPMEIEIDTASQVAFVFGENQAEHVDNAFEPVLLDESGQVEPLTLVVDDLLMALPLMPVHSHDCIEPALVSSGTIIDDEQRTDSENPFAALAVLKKNGTAKD